MSKLNLPGNIPEPVQALLVAVPDFSYGEKARQIYVNHLMSMTPGHASAWLGHERTFREVFFPNWQAIEGREGVMPITRLNTTWWADFAAAVLCQAMAYVTNVLRPQMLRAAIAQDVQAKNQELRQHSAPFYAWVLGRTFEPLKNLIAGDAARAKEQYRQALIANAAAPVLWQPAEPGFPVGWALFHHYAKLLALGATAIEVDEVIDALQGAGLDIPAVVAKSAWRAYPAHFGQPADINYRDVAEAARNGLMGSTALPSYGGVAFAMVEGYAFEFIARGQPGHKYYRAPNSGSCFSGNTLVLLANGQAKPIRALRPGEMVATPSGPQRVGFISTPLLHHRSLRQVNGLAFGFTDSHPFVQLPGLASAIPQPGLLCVNPEALLANIPSVAQVGLGTLQTGANLWGITDAANVAAPAVIPVTSLTPYSTSAADPHVYDLVLLGSAGQTPQFYVGDGRQFVLTTTEMPILADFPYAAVAIITALVHATPALANLANGAQAVLTEPEVADKLFARLHFLSVTQLTQWLAKLAPTIDPAALLQAPPLVKTASLRNQLEDYLTGLDDLDSAQNVAFGAFFEKLTSRLAEELELAVHLGWRSFPATAGEVVALSMDMLRLQVEQALPPGARLRLEIKTLGLPNTESFTCWNTGGRPNTTLVQHFDQVLYLQTPYRKGELQGLALAWYLEDAHTPVAVTTSYWPESLQAPYRRFCPQVFTPQGQVAGECHYDVRLLTHEQATAEKPRMAAWQANTAAKDHYAHQLGLRLGAILNEFARLPFER